MNLDNLKTQWQNQKGDNNLSEIQLQTLLQKAKVNADKYESFMLFVIKFYFITTIASFVFIIFMEMQRDEFRIPKIFMMQIPLILIFSYYYYLARFKKYGADNYSFVKASIKKFGGDFVFRLLAVTYTVVLFLTTHPENFFKTISITPTVFYLNILMYLLMIGYGLYIYFTLHKPTLKYLKQLKKLYEKIDPLEK